MACLLAVNLGFCDEVEPVFIGFWLLGAVQIHEVKTLEALKMATDKGFSKATMLLAPFHVSSRVLRSHLGFFLSALCSYLLVLYGSLEM